MRLIDIDWLMQQHTLGQMRHLSLVYLLHSSSMYYIFTVFNIVILSNNYIEFFTQLSAVCYLTDCTLDVEALSPKTTIVTTKQHF